MMVETRWVPSAICRMWEISCVAAPCSSTAAAMVEELSDSFSGVASGFDAVLPHASPDPEKIDAGGVVRTGSGRSESLEAREGPPNFASYRPTNASKRRLVKGSARSAKARMRSTCSLQKSSSITPPPTLA